MNVGARKHIETLVSRCIDSLLYKVSIERDLKAVSQTINSQVLRELKRFLWLWFTLVPRGSRMQLKVEFRLDISFLESAPQVMDRSRQDQAGSFQSIGE